MKYNCNECDFSGTKQSDVTKHKKMENKSWSVWQKCFQEKLQGYLTPSWIASSWLHRNTLNPTTETKDQK